MTARVLFALLVVMPALLAPSGVSEAARSPDATEVGLGTAALVVGVMAFLTVVYAVKVALGGGRMPPPDEGSLGGHH
ncbi:MAG TPA: hypothetical protein VNN10_14165 [Dehalococcoidia bacterium]|nr:hypothetical protein [Dehalococcoidia bacterium]